MQNKYDDDIIVQGAIAFVFAAFTSVVLLLAYWLKRKGWMFGDDVYNVTIVALFQAFLGAKYWMSLEDASRETPRLQLPDFVNVVGGAVYCLVLDLHVWGFGIVKSVLFVLVFAVIHAFEIWHTNRKSRPWRKAGK